MSELEPELCEEVLCPVEAVACGTLSGVEVGGPAYLNWESLWSEAESLRSHCSNLERKEAPRGNCGEGWLDR